MPVHTTVHGNPLKNPIYELTPIMSESDPVFKENNDKCEDSNISQASSDNPGTMPTFQTIEIVETPENNSQEFVNETASANDEDSNDGSGGSECETQSEGPAEVSESEASQELDSDENSNRAKEVSNKICVNDEVVQNQDDDTSAKSWPTLDILPGGIIRPTENEYPYCIYVDEPQTDDLMYACAKCPMRFKVLNSLTMHLRDHAENTKKKAGLEAYKKLKKRYELQRRLEKIQMMKKALKKAHKNKIKQKLLERSKGKNK